MRETEYETAPTNPHFWIRCFRVKRLLAVGASAETLERQHRVVLRNHRFFREFDE